MLKRLVSNLLQKDMYEAALQEMIYRKGIVEVDKPIEELSNPRRSIHFLVHQGCPRKTASRLDSFLASLERGMITKA